MKNVKVSFAAALLLIGLAFSLYSFTGQEAYVQTSTTATVACNCYYKGVSYSDGATTCQNGYEYECERDAEDDECRWKDKGNRCKN